MLDGNIKEAGVYGARHVSLCCSHIPHRETLPSITNISPSCCGKSVSINSSNITIPCMEYFIDSLKYSMIFSFVQILNTPLLPEESTGFIMAGVSMELKKAMASSIVLHPFAFGAGKPLSARNCLNNCL